jgi:hypothetical protein
LSDGAVDLVEQDIDLALRNGPLADSALKARLMPRGRRVVCAAPSYWTNQAASNHPDDRAANTLGMKQATLSRKLTALDRADVRFIRPNIQIYDAHVVDLYQWVCVQYLVGVKGAEKSLLALPRGIEPLFQP